MDTTLLILIEEGCDYDDNIDRYDLNFEYLKRDKNTKTSLSLSFKDVKLPTLKKIVQGNFNKIVLEDESEEWKSGMSWKLTIGQKKCLLKLDDIEGAASFELKFRRHYLVNVLRDKIEVLRDLPFRANIKRANK
uniref:Uncharacterized protein n=1 Tax=Marseillevirus LCMAC101 TaxID=2506602 RepID=A0A481YRG6_9VIRU|nr:MAG: hypothetical protein LCMAC101_03770 [Marseillevirus LCMAC101]